MLAAHFSRFLAANPGLLHFAAHSHHPWPDVTQAAHARYWEDSATLADRKWAHVFGTVLPAAQDHVARLLCISDPRQIAFAPNTHEFVARLYSCLDWSRPVRVLASAHEFHSFRRQTRRLAETGRLVFSEIPAEPYATFDDRFRAAAASGDWDLVWLSHVFFDSGFVVRDLERIVRAAPGNAIVAIDGYHAFHAFPVDLSSIRDRAFYLGGGYKYAMSGEGACFLAIPPGCDLRPADTGWFASFDSLSGRPGMAVPYSRDAFRFWGSTFDASGLYRFNAVMDWLAGLGVTVADIRAHAQRLQSRFLAALAGLALPRLPADRLVPPAGCSRGNFLTFDIDGAEEVQQRLAAHGVHVDRRDRRLRFGFGVYHDEATVDALLEAVGKALR
ncbi:MAG TPA: aminotransferase class V-fold PLP-dependent enzyme [Usitatibacteraceae bacterium]|nr:aminotransferase class V-fold PLP-dependent enzyme [Usitatibacteraceae bacterium]